MSEWYEHEAKAECIDLRRQVAELERERDELKSSLDKQREYAKLAMAQRDEARVDLRAAEARVRDLIEAIDRWSSDYRGMPMDVREALVRVKSADGGQQDGM